MQAPAPYYAAKVEGRSSFKFWVWLDSLPRKARDDFNHAKDGDECLWHFKRYMTLHPPHPLTGKATRV